jgi:histidyl-tRNA synthetase
VLIGPDDRAKGEVALKDLTGKMQESVPLSRIVEELKRKLN